MNSQTLFTQHVLQQGCLNGQPFQLLDVGASGGIQPHWNVFRPHLRAVGFDPLVTEVERLNRAETDPNVRYEDGFIGSGKCRPVVDKLHSRDNSSFARTSAVRATNILNMNYQKEVFNSGAEMVWSKKQLTLDGWLPEAERQAVDFIKIDTDGSDFPVLRGAGQTLAAGGVLGLSVECAFHGPVDDEGNLFCNIDRFLRGHGFTLFDLDVYRYSRAALPRPFLYDIPAQTTHGGVQWGEALYLRDLGDADFERMWGREFSPAKKLKLACLFEMFDLPDCAIELLQKYRSELAPLVDFERSLDWLTPDLAGEKLSYARYNETFDSCLKQRKVFPFGREKPAATQPIPVQPSPEQMDAESARWLSAFGRLLNRPEPVSEFELQSATDALNALLASADVSRVIDRGGTRNQPVLLPLILYHLSVARRENNDLLGDVLAMLYGRITRQAAARSARLAVPAASAA